MLNAQVEGFVAVAREGNLRRAAEQLYVSQPALTARIQGLEAELGTPLFRRTRSGMELTHAGRAFLPYAQRALESLRGGAALVAELSEGVVGELTIGAAPAVSAYVLPELLVRYTERYPNVRLVVRTSHSEALVDMVVRGEVQLAVVREMRDARIVSRPLFEDQLVLVTRPDHRSRRQAHRHLGHPPGAAHPVRPDVVLLRPHQRPVPGRGVIPRGVMELDNIEAAKRMVEHGLGVALLPGTAVAQSLVDGTLTEAELVGAGPIQRRMVMVEHPGSRGSRRRPPTSCRCWSGSPIQARPLQEA